MKVKKSNSSKTVLTICLGFLIIHIVGQNRWALSLSVIIGLIGVFSDFLSEKVEIIWLYLTKILSYIVPNILLSIVFYFILFPIGLLSRLFGIKDSLKLKGGSPSYFIEINKKFQKEDFDNPW